MIILFLLTANRIYLLMIQSIILYLSIITIFKTQIIFKDQYFIKYKDTIYIR